MKMTTSSSNDDAAQAEQEEESLLRHPSGKAGVPKSTIISWLPPLLRGGGSSRSSSASSLSSVEINDDVDSTEEEEEDNNNYSINDTVKKNSNHPHVRANNKRQHQEAQPFPRSSTMELLLQQNSNESRRSNENSCDDDHAKGDHPLGTTNTTTTGQKDNTKLEQYLLQREMSPLQESCNALSILPSVVYCLWFLASLFREKEAIPSTCVAIALGIVLHAPFSFLYHWHYAVILKDRHVRSQHWSRRLDQCMIHVASVCASYGTSGGSLWYLVGNVLYNAECMYLQFKKEVKPRRNQVRILLSILLYTVPILWIPEQEAVTLFVKCWMVLAVSLWLFATYPLRGWSHTSFHLVIALLPPLLFHAALCRLEQQ